jgi:hypothetical protein
MTLGAALSVVGGTPVETGRSDEVFASDASACGDCVRQRGHRIVTHELREERELSFLLRCANVTMIVLARRRLAQLCSHHRQP